MGTIVTLAPLGRGPSALCSQCRRWRRPQGADDQRWDLADPPRWIQTQREYLVEAAGVELSSMLTARKLLILRTATTAKKAPLPRSIVRSSYENALALEFCRHDTLATVSWGE